MDKLRKGWDMKLLGEIATISSGGTPNRKNETYWKGSIPWVTTAEVKFNTIFDTSEKITEDGLNNSSAKLFPVNTILMAMYGQGKTRGQVAKLGIEATTNQACAAIMLKDGYFVDFYYQYLMSKYNDIREMSNSGGQENLSASIIKTIKVPVPPLPEQIKIAEILSTWDNAIQTTEKQLANSQQQKKALMQMLLSGEKRVAGFSGEWNTAKFAELATISKGTQRNKDTLSDTGLYPVINGGIEPSGYTDQFNSSRNTITISEGGNSCGYVAFQKQDFWCGGHCYALENVQIDNLFLYQLLKANEESIMRLRVGSGLPNIQKKALEGFSLRYPKEMIEQQKIAEILTTADQEIETLQRKLECLKLEKRALMQKLL